MGQIAVGFAFFVPIEIADWFKGMKRHQDVRKTKAKSKKGCHLQERKVCFYRRLIMICNLHEVIKINSTDTYCKYERIERGKRRQTKNRKWDKLDSRIVFPNFCGMFIY